MLTDPETRERWQPALEGLMAARQQVMGREPLGSAMGREPLGSAMGREPLGSIQRGDVPYQVVGPEHPVPTVMADTQTESDIMDAIAKMASSFLTKQQKARREGQPVPKLDDYALYELECDEQDCMLKELDDFRQQLLSQSAY